MGMSLAVTKSKSDKPRFPPEKFQTIRDVAVFAEHKTKLRDGTPVTYDRVVLEKIAANCNRRIEETGNYAAVCIGHTDKDQGDKPLIGFAGPFRVEERDGRAVLLADLHIFREDADKLKRYPRPSPEVWIPTDGFDPDRIFLDPIAMLGAETPRLDLGMTFLYRARDGALQCEKYAAHPSAASVSIPQLEEPNKGDRYNMAANLTQEDIQAILKAIESTDWFAWLRQQMAASQKTGDDKTKDAATSPSENDAKKDQYAKDDGDDDDLDEPEPGPKDKYAAGDDDFARWYAKNYGAEGDYDDATEDRPKRVDEYRRTTHYAKREAVLEAQREIYQLRRELEHERALRVNSERRRVLENLGRRYALDLKEEMAVCAYGKMSDEQFAKHIDRIERFYRPLPVDQNLPIWAEAYAEPDMSKETYQRKQQDELSARARDYVKELANRGQWISYNEALQLAKQGKI